MTSSDETIRVTEGQLIALSNVHPGVWGAVKEVFANAEGYATDGVGPYCDAVLANEESADKAYIYFTSHSSIKPGDAVEIFNLGHRSDAKEYKHRKFNIGTYIVAGKMCRVGKTGMTVITFDPVTKRGMVMRAYLCPEGYVCKVDPVPITLDQNGRPTLFSTARDATERNRIEKLWLGTQWENGEFNQGASHKDYCNMLWDTTVKHAMTAIKGKNYATTSFLYFDLKTVVVQGTDRPACFLKSTFNDILERDGGSPAYGFRNTVREHFMPFVNRMPLVGAEIKKRDFRVIGQPVSLGPSGADDAPWCAKIAKVINDAPRVGQEWYRLNGGQVHVKFCNVEINAQQAIDNFKHYSRNICGDNSALPVGVVCTHFDKIISKRPYSFHMGETFQLVPEAATKWEPLANALLTEGRVKPEHVDALWDLMGVPEARLEIAGQTAEIRDKQLKINASWLQVDQSGTKGYKFLCELLIRPFRKARKLVDIDGVKKTTGVFKIEQYVNDKRDDLNYMSRASVKERKQSGELDSDANYANRMGYMAILGLTTAAVMQVGNCEQPMDKERLLDDANSKKLHREFFRCLVHHVLVHPTKEVATVRNAFLAKWREVEADAQAEEKAVEWIYAEYNRRVLAEEKRKAEVARKAQLKAAEAERKRQEAEAKADEEKRKREELERRQAEGNRMSSRLAYEEAQRSTAVQAEMEKARKAQERASRKEQKMREAEARAVQLKQDQDRIKREENERKAQARESRGKAAQSLFSNAVAGLSESWDWPEDMVLSSDKVDGKGDLFPRTKATKDTTRINEGHQAVEAAAYAFEQNSLKPGSKRKLESWVTGDIAKAMLESIMADDCMIKALGLEYNWHNHVGSRSRSRKATAAAAPVVAPEPDTEDEEDDGAGVGLRLHVAAPPRKRQRGANNDEAGGSGAAGVHELDDVEPASAEAEAPPTEEEEEDDVEDEEEVEVDADVVDESAEQPAPSVAEI